METISNYVAVFQGVAKRSRAGFSSSRNLSTNLKMVKHNETIRRQIADELFECLTILWGWRLKG